MLTKFFQQPLAKLPKRFGLPDDKGLFCYAYNKMENWSLVRKQPPDFSYYVNPYKDNEETKAAKKYWYQNTKLMEEHFDFNNDCVLYCKLDVKVYLAQSFSLPRLIDPEIWSISLQEKGKNALFSFVYSTNHNWII